MAIGVNARTSFSLLFPPMLDEFGWDRGLAAGIFSFGFFVSAVRRAIVGTPDGPSRARSSVELGVAMIAVGLLLAPRSRASRGRSTSTLASWSGAGASA